LRKIGRQSSERKKQKERKREKKDRKYKKSRERIIERSNSKDWTGKNRYIRRDYSGCVVG